ncbi:hypothetical protein, partial [Pusillibacter faecalis]|uniref:hypothetical protein n=1 Tax=Pusillibacter faecalis TaxID=2714358 RepID=UPI002942FEF2
GNNSFVADERFGTSKRRKAEGVRKQVNAAAKEGIHYRGYNPLENAAAGAAIVGAGITGVRHLIKGKSDKEKMEAEQQWYTIICDMLDTVIS